MNRESFLKKILEEAEKEGVTPEDMVWIGGKFFGEGMAKVMSKKWGADSV